MLLVIINLLESQDKNKRLFRKVTKQKKNLLPIQKKGKTFET
jgi:hypothetical protein